MVYISGWKVLVFSGIPATIFAKSRIALNATSTVEIMSGIDRAMRGNS
jgi:hypothetical protein